MPNSKPNSGALSARNHFPVRNYYLQLVGRGNDGKLMHKTIGTVLQNRADAYVQDCKMK